MQGCPHLEELERFVGDDLSSDVRARLDGHVRTCAQCKARLSELVANRGLLAELESLGPLDQPLPNASMPQTIGAYAVIRELGRGGMGVVYEAYQKHPRRRVAVKVVRGGEYVDERRVRLFQREVQALARLKHRGIAGIHEAGCTEDGQHFFAMELVEGVPLGVYVRSEEAPLSRRLQLFGEVCDAINYAHQRGVIHRDLKPSNILIDAQGRARILDFGLAKITDVDVAMATLATEVGRIQRTLPYMSPEQACGNAPSIDLRSDVYSLGVILFELVSGELPYEVDARKLPEAVRIICEQTPRRPSSVDRALRGDIETIIVEALEKEHDRRYQSVAYASRRSCSP